MANKRDKKDTSKKPPPKQQSSFSFGKVFIVLAVLSGLAAYYVYNVATTPPPLLQMDLDAWWGPYPITQKPDDSIRPFQIEFSDVIVNDLQERLLHRRDFAPPLEGAGFTYGFNSDFLTRVLDYWQNQYNFKDRENFLNQYNHYKTNIQGLDIHFVHVKPKNIDAEVVPLLLLHGWPGSFREFYEMIPKLVTPRPGYNFVFDLIIPSLPGFGFSQAASRPGFGPAEAAVVLHNLMRRLGHSRYFIQGGDAGHFIGPHMATLFQDNAASRPGFGPAEAAVVLHNLMRRLGHSRYFIQGGDAGHVIGSHMATLFQDNVIGFHTNCPVLMFNTLANLYVVLGQFWPSLIVEPELQNRMYPWGEKTMYMLEESGYMHIQATKPDTIGAALTDSPAGLAAYILEKFSTWTNPAYRKASDGNLLAKYTLTHLLDNVMIYWASNCITTSVRFYAEALSLKQLALKLDEVPTLVPTWGIKFKHELVFHPDIVLKLKYRNYLHSTIVEDGGHFAALEHPELMANDVFEAVEAFQQFHATSNHSKSSPSETLKTIYDFTVRDINGRNVKLDKYRGHVSIIVNVASQCGYTENHYKELNELYEKYKNKGLRILAFPCNQFGGQEPGNTRDILTFTKSKGVKFDLFEKVEVNGDNAHPLWNFLKSAQSGTLTDSIKWNFSKFIVDKNGVPVERFGPNISPLQLEAYLAKYW